MTTYSIALYPLADARFGVRSAQADNVTLHDLPKALAYCRENAIEVLFARCAATDFGAVHALESNGFLLMDTLVHYTADLSRVSLWDVPDGLTASYATAEDADIVEALATRAFRGYIGHFHTDPRLNSALADGVYSAWARHTCATIDADSAVQVFTAGAQAVGFVSARQSGPDRIDIPLYGVDPDVQRRGVGKALLSCAMRWGLARGAARAHISTQIVNTVSQAAFVCSGFVLTRAEYTFHKWFDESPETRSGT